MSEMRVLLSAFACAPGCGSEPAIGWGLAERAWRHHRLWVLTDAANESVIRQEIARSPLPRVQFVFVTVPRWLCPRIGIVGFHHLYYLLWQFFAFREARRLHHDIGFDLVHHVTYVNPWMPSFMGFLGAPFVWSAGCSDRTPRRFLRQMSWRGRWAERSRNLALRVLGPVTRACTASRATMILTSSDNREWDLDVPIQVFPLGGLAPDEMSMLASIGPRREPPFRVASIGRLLGLKGFGLGLQAFAEFHRHVPGAEYWIIGDGPERQALQRLAIDLGCPDAVRFLGWLPREEMLARLREIDVLVHPSLHEQFGYVVLEGMAAGKPVVCLTSSGSPALLDPRAATVIARQSPQQVVVDLHLALRRLAADPAERERQGRRARSWAQETWNWDSVTARLGALYDRAARLAS